MDGEDQFLQRIDCGDFEVVAGLFGQDVKQFRYVGIDPGDSIDFGEEWQVGDGLCSDGCCAISQIKDVQWFDVLCEHLRIL